MKRKQRCIYVNSASLCLTCDSVLCTHCVKSGLFDSSQEMKKEMPFLSHCIVIGDDRKYLTMLVTLKCEVRIDGKKGKGEERRGGEGRGGEEKHGDVW